jgi:hypothetical protein
MEEEEDEEDEEEAELVDRGAHSSQQRRASSQGESTQGFARCLLAPVNYYAACRTRQNVNS